MYNFGSELAQTYSEKCECGKVVEVSAQKDFAPEYIIQIFVKCECGLAVEFALPVN